MLGLHFFHLFNGRWQVREEIILWVPSSVTRQPIQEP